MHTLPNRCSGTAATDRASRLPFIAGATAVCLLVGLALWENRQATDSLKRVAPVSIQGAIAGFTAADPNQRAFVSEQDETSDVWLIKTDMLLSIPGKELRIHCAWSGSICTQIKAMTKRGPIDARVLPVEFPPHYWLLEANVDGRTLVGEDAQR